MAIAYNNSSISSQVSSTSLTYSHTVSGTNRILFVGIQGGTTDIVTGVTYNGVSMTLINKDPYPSSGRWAYLYYLLNPATGTNNVVVSASGTNLMISTASSYTGVSQLSQPDASNKNTGSGASFLTTSVTTVNNNCWTVLFNANNQGTPTAGSGSTSRQASSNGAGMFDSNSQISPAGSYSMSVNLPGSGNSVNLMASFHPVIMYDVTMGTGYFTITGYNTVDTIIYNIVMGTGYFTMTFIDFIQNLFRKWDNKQKNTSSFTNDIKN